MQAVVYHQSGTVALEQVPDPTIEAVTDAIVRVDTATICGTDLHIWHGDVPEVEEGRVLGHEAVGTIEAIGSGVRARGVGDRVLVSCITACATCQFCRLGRFGQCQGGGGWRLGHTLDGTHAELVRVPFADTSTHLVPAGVKDESILMLSDILPTAYEVGVRNGCVEPGDAVAIVGAGPIGLAAIETARLLSPSAIVAIDLAETRLDAAARFGADVTVNNGSEDPWDTVSTLTGGLGVDVAIEAVGVPATFELATRLVRPGGHVANVGVHGQPAAIHLEELWSKDVTITTGLVDTYSTPTLLRLVAAEKLDPSPFVTHRYPITEAMDAYDVFRRAGETAALKVLLTR